MGKDLKSGTKVNSIAIMQRKKNSGRQTEAQWCHGDDERRANIYFTNKRIAGAVELEMRGVVSGVGYEGVCWSERVDGTR
jgi:hypothetical protein